MCFNVNWFLMIGTWWSEWPMPCICLLDVFIVICVISVHVHSSNLRFVPHRLREHAFSSGVYYEESLTWAVKLDVSFLNDEDVRNAADAVAADVGLVNHGQIGSLDRYYIFSHPSGVGTKQPALSSMIFQNLTRTISQDQHGQIKDKIHQMLDNHPFVEWYMLQRIVPRYKRTAASRKLSTVPLRRSAVHFNDPLYLKQWHLVRTICRQFLL